MTEISLRAYLPGTGKLRPKVQFKLFCWNMNYLNLRFCILAGIGEFMLYFIFLELQRYFRGIFLLMLIKWVEHANENVLMKLFENHVLILVKNYIYTFLQL